MDNKDSKFAIRYITYGDEQYADLLEQITAEARDIGYFTHVTAETNETIKDYIGLQVAMKSPNFADTFNDLKGGGYWLWKPLIVYQELLRMHHDDILFYSDCGCEIVSNDETISRLKQHTQMAQSSPTGFVGFCNPHPEHLWTKADVYRHFNTQVTDFSDIPGVYQYRQVTANRFVIRKTPESVKMIKAWWEAAKFHPELFTDEPSIEPNCDEFIGNKHDQSVLSVICKTHKATLDKKWSDIAIKRRRGK